MRRITKITPVCVGSVLFAGLAGTVPGSTPLAEFETAMQADTQARRPGPIKSHLEVAADCRTFVNGPNRADVSFGSGKIFPAETLPSEWRATIQPNPSTEFPRSAIGSPAARTVFRSP